MVNAVKPSTSSTMSHEDTRGVLPGEPRLDRVPLAAAAAMASIGGIGLIGDELLRLCPHRFRMESRFVLVFSTLGPGMPLLANVSLACRPLLTRRVSTTSSHCGYLV
eukprot:m.102315 g.102315  ORF g.102315 m.102315 type:complete len:107 (-) comp10433_c0_seq1:387-707(-)